MQLLDKYNPIYVELYLLDLSEQRRIFINLGTPEKVFEVPLMEKDSLDNRALLVPTNKEDLKNEENN